MLVKLTNKTSVGIAHGKGITCMKRGELIEGVRIVCLLFR